MSYFKNLILDQSEEVHELLSDCDGFSVLTESRDHVVISCPSRHQARGMAHLLRDRGYTSAIFNGDRIRAEYRHLN